MKPSKKKRGHIALIQNVCILCLSALAAALLVTVFSYESDGRGPIPTLNNLLSGSVEESSQSSDLVGMAVPFNLVVNSERGRFGHMLASAESASLLHSSNLLLEAMGSAGSGVPATAEQFRIALEGTSLFLDYLFPVPSSILAGWYGADFIAPSGQEIRYVLISAAQDERVSLYLWDGIGDITRYSTAVEFSNLSELILALSSAASDVAFAFEDPETYGHLSPYTVLSGEAAETKVLTLSLPSLASDVDTLLSMLDFNPHSIARYNLTNGIEVVEYPRTFRVYQDGVIQYNGDTAVSSPLYIVPSQAEAPTEAEAVLAARRLAEILLLEDVLLGTDFYFTGIRPTEEGYTITFDYLVDGIPVHLASGAAALEVRTEGTAITYFRLQYRQYTAADDYHLLPLAQAVHMSTAYQDAFLTKGYVDRGGETVVAQWLIQ